MFSKSTVAAAVLSGVLLAGAAVPSMAADRNCGKRMQKAEHNLQQAVRKHGDHSKQAQQRREQLERVRANCRVNDRDHDRDHRGGPDHRGPYDHAK